MRPSSRTHPTRPLARLRAGLLAATCVAFLFGCGKPPTALVVGLDGADWDLLDPLIEHGHVPTLAALIEGGARADFSCATASPSFSCYCPPVWVSLVTGQVAHRHSIFHIEQYSTARTAPALWEVVEATGGWSVLVSYRNLWPVHQGNDIVLTERATSWAGARNFDVGRGIPLGTTVAQAIHPPELLEQLGLLPFTTDAPPAIDVTAKDRLAMEAVDRVTHLSELAAMFGFERPRLTLVLLHAIDKIGHVTWPDVQGDPDDPIDRASVLSLAERWDGPVGGIGDPVSAYLEIDRWLGRLLATAPFDYVVLASDHGMTRSRSTSGLPGSHGIGSPEAHVGIFSITGPGVRPGTRLDDVDVLDVAPTVAYALGLPVASDLDGRVVEEAFGEGWRALRPIQWVPTW